MSYFKIGSGKHINLFYNQEFIERKKEIHVYEKFFSRSYKRNSLAKLYYQPGAETGFGFKSTLTDLDPRLENKFDTEPTKITGFATLVIEY